MTSVNHRRSLPDSTACIIGENVSEQTYSACSADKSAAKMQIPYPQRISKQSFACSYTSPLERDFILSLGKQI